MLQYKNKIRLVTLLGFLFTFSMVNSQSLPIDFETVIITEDFTDFDGGAATVLANPQSSGINTSSMVAKIVRDGGALWAGSKIELAANLDFTTLNIISMKVFTAAPVGTIVKFKLEGSVSTERDAETTVSNEWEELQWDFTGEPANFNTIVFMFDFGNVGDSSETSTFLFDDIELIFGGTHIDLPVDFEGSTVNFTMTDFGGNKSSLVADPTDAENMVMQVIKTDQAATWAGTTIGVSAGFATDIPLSLSASKMTVKVWSPDANIPVRLKVEDSKDPTHTCETETMTSVSGDWDVLEFDFSNQANGTESLSVGLNNGWTYNKASIFFNFGTEGVSAGEKTYYFDDVEFGELVHVITNTEKEEMKVYPNPSNYQWNITSENTDINMVEVFDVQGQLMQILNPDAHTVSIDASNFANGIYISKVSTSSGTSFIRLVKN